MRMLIRICALLALCFMAAALFGASYTYTITVTVSGNGKFTYTHVEATGKGKHGDKGHQEAGAGDTIKWVCDSSCSNLIVRFKNDNSPCAAAGATCVVSDLSSMAIFPYSIAANYSSGTKIAVDDPDVIVDNVGMLGNQKNK